MMANVARDYYLADKSKVEIAEEYGVSRYKVARLLQAGRELGLIEFSIRLPTQLDAAASAALRQRFGLKQAIVVRVAEGASLETLRRAFAPVVADYLTETIEAGDVVGLAWSRLMVAASHEITRLAPATLVQASGVMVRDDLEETAVELVRRLARVSGGPAISFYAPIVVPTAAAAASLRDGDVAAALDKLSTINRAIVSIGAWGPGLSTVYDGISPAESAALAMAGVVGECAGILFGESGEPLPGLADRVMGMTYAQFRQAEHRAAIAYGMNTALAARALAGSGAVDTLITSDLNAAEMLTEP
jgi:DNA-binding transcriptional regulator LsrR (DeoR family)